MGSTFKGLRCSDCMGNLEFNKTSKLWICPYCGKEFERDLRTDDNVSDITDVVRATLSDISKFDLDSAKRNLSECEKMNANHVGTLIANIVFYLFSASNSKSKEDIEKLEFPGNNKLIIGLDGSLFVTKNNTIIDVTPKKQSVIEKEYTQNVEITNIKSASVSGRLYSDEGYLFDFANGELFVRTLSVDDEINIPHDTVKNRCCRTYTEKIDVDGVELDRVVRNYVDYDFVELVEIPDFIIVKSGAILKATNAATLFVYVSEIETKFTFEANGLYIIYEQGNEVIITKLN